jgi:hypothetical protein
VTASRLRLLSAAAGALLIVAGCAGSGATHIRTLAPDPIVVKTAGPTAKPTAPAGFADQVAAACHGVAVPGAVPFGGSVHPLYVVHQGGNVQRADKQNYSFNSEGAREAWLREEWTDPLQLVVCAGSEKRVEVDSCGNYVGPTGNFEVIRYRLTMDVTIVAAATGATLRTETVSGSDPGPCPMTSTSRVILGMPANVYQFALALAGS